MISSAPSLYRRDWFCIVLVSFLFFVSPAMGNFDFTIFMHASYVAFAYALVAWGATYYRQFLDDLDVREVVRMGEDIYIAYDPFGILLILVLFVFFLTFAALALYVFPLEVRFYVIPLAFVVNIVQFAYRYHRQRLMVKTLGIVGRSIFDSKIRIAPYRAIKKIEFKREMLWGLLILHFYDTGNRGELRELHVRLSKRTLPTVLHTAESNTGLKAIERVRTVQVHPEPSDPDKYL